MSFTAKCFEDLQDASISGSDVNLGVIKDPESSQSNAASEAIDQKNWLRKEGSLSTSSETDSDTGEKGNTDDDDDRNHKHRRRDGRPYSSDNGSQEQHIVRHNRKRSKNYDNGQLHMEKGIESREIQDYNFVTYRKPTSRMDKRYAGISQSLHGSSDLSSWSRLNSSLFANSSPQFDVSTPADRAYVGRGRRNSAAWIRPDSRSTLETLDFASHMASPGPAYPSLFVGPGLQSAQTSQNASWNAFGFIHGMPNGILDPLHPLGLQAAIRPNMYPSMNHGMTRPRCRDFEERGFCLRGDMCPMEHGVNRIVVEDVQSLSQFNLPVSMPTSHTLGVQSGKGSLHPGPASSAIMANKTMPCKNNKSAASDDELRLNACAPSVSIEADVYDPDQPLWNNNHPDSSDALLRLPLSNAENDFLWDGDAASRRNSQFSGDNGGDFTSKNLTAYIEPLTAGSSVWGRIGFVSKQEKGVGNNKSTNGQHAKVEVKEKNVCCMLPLNQGKPVTNDIDSEMPNTQFVFYSRTEYELNNGRMQQKASRTLYVNGIPQNKNRKEVLLAHFQKFGEVIDIYIPINSEKAFVQFSKREEAEAALNSPDAVMGNRFIKLFWANRDRVSVGGQISGLAKPLLFSKVLCDSVHKLPSALVEGKENPAAQKKDIIMTVDVPRLSFGSHRSMIMNEPKALISPSKKVESLEILEELRKKREMLDQKREEFQRQLVKFERQASVKKIDAASDQIIKRQKLDMESAAVKAADPGPITASILGECRHVGKTLDKSSIGEIAILPSPKAHPAVMLQSPRMVKQATHIAAPHPNRFKIDNRPTSFKILPPLPAKIANVAVLKEHFSKFGDLASIVFQGSVGIPNNQRDRLCSEELEKSFVCVKYHTRHSAERAYQAGKSLEGCSLKFIWVNTPCYDKDSHLQEAPINTVVCSAGDDANKKLSSEMSSSLQIRDSICIAGSGSQSLCREEPSCIPVTEVDTKSIEGPDISVDSINCASINVPNPVMDMPMH